MRRSREASLIYSYRRAGGSPRICFVLFVENVHTAYHHHSLRRCLTCRSSCFRSCQRPTHREHVAPPPIQSNTSRPLLSHTPCYLNERSEKRAGADWIRAHHAPVAPSLSLCFARALFAPLAAFLPQALSLQREQQQQQQQPPPPPQRNKSSSLHTSSHIVERM